MLNRSAECCFRQLFHDTVTCMKENLGRWLSAALGAGIGMSVEAGDSGSDSSFRHALNPATRVQARKFPPGTSRVPTFPFFLSLPAAREFQVGGLPPVRLRAAS